VAPGGLLIYETFGEEQASIGKPSRPDFLLRRASCWNAARAGGCSATRTASSQPDRFVQRIAAVRPGGAPTPSLPVSAQG
jgi:hypothetical protein